MDRRIPIFCVLFLAAWFAGKGMAVGAGFALYEGNIRGNGLGGALVARGDDPSAAFYNPAGLTQVPGLQVLAGGTVITPQTSVVVTHNGKATDTATKPHHWLAPHAYVSWQCSDRAWLGLGAFSRFGLGTEFDADWPGRYNNTKAFIQTLSFNPNLAVKITDALSMAVGLEGMWLDLTLEQHIDFPNLTAPDPQTYASDIHQTLTGDSVGYGYNLALLYRFRKWASLGISYRSRIVQDIHGDVQYQKPPAIQQAYPTVFNDTTAWGEITLPETASFGVAFFPSPTWTLEVGGTWTGWSTYENLTIHYGAPLLDPVSPGVTSSTRKKNWRDVWRLQAGLEYRSSHGVDYRLGYAWDESPVPDETVDYLVPTNDRHLFSVGLGTRRGSWTLDLSYTYLLMGDRMVAARPREGVFDSRFEQSNAHLVGVGVGYSF